MKQITKYICDLCGAEYESESDCEECEAHHILPVDIQTASIFDIECDRPGYPIFIRMMMRDGRVVEYKYNNIADDVVPHGGKNK